MPLDRNLKSKLPNNLKGSLLWEDIMDVIEEELGLFKDQIYKKKFYLYPFEQDDVDLLKSIAKSFGFIINTSIKEDLDYVIAYFKAIPFLIKMKGTLPAYNFIFKLIEKPGGVYIIPQLNGDIYKIIDFDSTIANLSPEKTIQPTIYQITDFGYVISPTLYFDSGWSFDEDPPIEFDGLGEQPTQNLAIEYDCLSLLDPEDINSALFTKEYFEYMIDSVNNFRKQVTVPMIGTQLSLYSDLNTYYNTYHQISALDGKEYTYPNILCNAAQTKYFRQKNEIDPFIFDDSPDRPFDGVEQWAFDITATSGDIKTLESLFHKIYLGIGKKGLQSESCPDIESGLILYLPLNRVDLFTNTVREESFNDYTCDIINGYAFEQGIIGKAFKFDGTNYIVVNDVNFTTTDLSLNFFFKFTDEGTGVLFDCNNFIQINGGGTGTSFEINFDVGGSEFTVSSLLPNQEYMLSLVYNDADEEVSIYLDGTFLFTNFLIYAFSPTTEDLYIGCNRFTTSNFFGIIEEFRVYNRQLTVEEISFFWENKYGTQSSLAYPIFSREIFTKEKYNQIIDADTSYYGVATAVEAQRVYEELGYTDIGGLFTLDYTATFPAFVPNNIILNIRTIGSGGVTVENEVRDDPVTGNFTLGSDIVATVDYDTNIISIDLSTSAIIKPETLVSIFYATDYEFEYTEAGIYDDEDNMVAYTTFAPISYKDMNNHFSLSWVFYNKVIEI